MAIKTNKYRKILVLQTAYIGDVVVSTALIKELNKLFPESTIDIISTPLSAEIFKYNPHIRKIHRFDKKNKKLINFFRLLSGIKKENYDLSISIQSSFTSAMLLYLAGIERRIGFSKQILTTDSVRMIEAPERHRSQNIVNLLSVLDDYEEFDFTTEIYFSEQEAKRARRIIKRAGKKDRKLIGIAPGSVRNTKEWTAEYFIKLVKMVGSDDIYLFFIGGEQEHQLCQKIIEESENPATANLAGDLSILESAALIDKMDLMISNDSAPLHMANAVNTDVFAFFGPTVRKFGFFPYRKDDKIFEVDLSCRPCSLHGGKKCPLGHHKCMKLIKPEDVYQAIIAHLNIRPG